MTATEPTAMKALTIRLQDELFAVEACSVREILDLVPITEVPNAPEFVGGLINVRGRVVPLADLRVMFGMDRPEPDQARDQRPDGRRFQPRTRGCPPGGVVRLRVGVLLDGTAQEDVPAAAGWRVPAVADPVMPASSP